MALGLLGCSDDTGGNGGRYSDEPQAVQDCISDLEALARSGDLGAHGESDERTIRLRAIEFLHGNDVAIKGERTAAALRRGNIFLYCSGDSGVADKYYGD